MTTPASGHGHLRSSRADRERVIDLLKAAYVYGLVTKDEFDERVGQTFASRTYAELAVLTADLPARLPALAPVPARTPAAAETAPGEGMLTAATATTAITAVLALAAALVLPNPVAGLLVIFAAGSAAVTMLLLARLVRGTAPAAATPSALAAPNLVSFRLVISPGLPRSGKNPAPAATTTRWL